MLTPIAIMSFNRPHFLAETLQTLLAQQGGDFDTREVHLFQDGSINRWSRMRYASEQDIQSCLDLFRQAFPRGRIHYTGENIGICENFCRAEAFFFEMNSFSTAWFFEDDMILSPMYFRMMEQLQRYAAMTPRVAYYSAYGNYYASHTEVASNRVRSFRSITTGPLACNAWPGCACASSWKDITRWCAGMIMRGAGMGQFSTISPNPTRCRAAVRRMPRNPGPALGSGCYAFAPSRPSPAI
jgi:hypothetical protein